MGIELQINRLTRRRSRPVDLDDLHAMMSDFRVARSPGDVPAQAFTLPRP